MASRGGNLSLAASNNTTLMLMLQQKTKKHTSKSVFYAVMLYKTMYKVTKFNKDLLQFASKEFIFSLFDLWNDHFAFLNAFYTSTRLVRKAFNPLDP